MMDKLISIIIPKQQEQTYLIRCLNAIKRQTYQNYEIILVTEQCEENLMEQYNLKIVKAEGEGKWNGIKQAMESACGDYLYFCSMTSVLAPNTLEELLKDGTDENKHSMGQFMILDGKNVKHADASVDELTIYGKLFLQSRIREEMIEFQEEMEFADYIFVASYEQNLKKIEENNFVYIYESNKTFFSDKERMVSGEEEVNALLLIAQEDNRYLKKIIAVLENKISDEVELDRILYHVISIAKVFPREYEINYQLAKKYLKKAFDLCQDTNEEENYQKFQAYFKEMESEENFFKTLLTVFELSEEKYKYLKECPLKEYSFFRDRMNDEKKRMEEEYLQLRESVERLEGAEVSAKEELRQLSMELDSVRNDILVINANTPRAVAEELTGPMLAEFVVDKYKNGGLGLKTLLLSLKVWISYKLRKGR